MMEIAQSLNIPQGHNFMEVFTLVPYRTEDDYNKINTERPVVITNFFQARGLLEWSLSTLKVGMNSSESDTRSL